MSQHKIKAKVGTLTPAKAQELLKLNNFKGQRPLKPNKLDAITDRMTKGLFHLADIALAHRNGHTYLANGQHTCTCVVSTGKSVPMVVQEKQCNTEGEVAEYFSQFDSLPGRSMIDTARAYCGGYGIEISPRVAAACGTAAIAIESALESFRLRVPKHEAMSAFVRHRKAADFVAMIAGTTNWQLLRIPVVAAMMQTFEKSVGDAEVFWSAVRDGDMLKKTDPAFKLRNYLYSSSAQGCDNRREVYVKCIHAWNAYRAKEATDLKYYEKAELPKVK